MKRVLISAVLSLTLLSCGGSKELPRAEASDEMKVATENYLKAVAEDKQDLHSIMILQDGKVIFEKWFGENKPEDAHILNSVSKTFTSMAVGLAISEGLFGLDDKVADIFPDKLPDEPSAYLKEMTVRHLLTMNCGHSKDPSRAIRENTEDWVAEFLANPVTHKPGTIFCYNSLSTYMLSAIVQKYSGEKIADYLQPRLFEPLGIENVKWDECPAGINTGGWGLYLKTEDLAKLGQMLLQNGKYNGKQIVPAEWVKAASSAQVESVPAGMNSLDTARVNKISPSSDWIRGYGYQMWRCRHNAYRADGARGQYIIVIPDKNAVVVTTADIPRMQAEINLIWDHILPAL